MNALKAWIKEKKINKEPSLEAQKASNSQWDRETTLSLLLSPQNLNLKIISVSRGSPSRA